MVNDYENLGREEAVEGLKNILSEIQGHAPFGFEIVDNAPYGWKEVK